MRPAGHPAATLSRPTSSRATFRQSRFYFDWQALALLPDARFDGVHPVKLLHELRLDDVLVAVVVHASQQHLLAPAAGRFSDRLAVISIKRPGPLTWATAALSIAVKMT